MFFSRTLSFQAHSYKLFHFRIKIAYFLFIPTEDNLKYKGPLDGDRYNSEQSSDWKRETETGATRNGSSTTRDTTKV